jgi:hypothetical protein
VKEDRQQRDQHHPTAESGQRTEETGDQRTSPDQESEFKDVQLNSLPYPGPPRNASPGTDTSQLLLHRRGLGESNSMTHEKLVIKAVAWLRSYGCGVVLSEQSCASGETPDAIGWKRGSHSVIVECKISRADFFIDQEKPFRREPAKAMGCERFYLAPAGLLRSSELPTGWGLLELRGRSVEVVCPSSKKLRSTAGLRHEMNLLLASLRRVEVRIEPQSITDFLKWKNRMAEYNRGRLPEGILPSHEEGNSFLGAEAVEGD